MKIIKVKIRNYKAIKDLEQKLDGNIFLVKGGNAVGKSTFASAFLKLVARDKLELFPVTSGEEEGKIEGEFVDAKGNRWTAVVEFTNDKNTIKLVTPESIVTSKVSDIKNLFGYTHIDMEEFLSWSETEPGRKKQRDVILNILPFELKEQFLNNEKRIKDAYEKRRKEGETLRMHEATLKAWKEDDFDMGDPTEEYLKVKKQYEESLSIASERRSLRESIETLSNQKEAVIHATNDRINRNLSEIEELEKKIRQLRIENEQMEKDKLRKVADLSDKIREKEEKLKKIAAYDTDTLREEYQKLSEAYEKYREIQKSKEVLGNLKKRIEESRERYDELNREVSTLRQENKDIISKADLGIEGLEVDETGLLYKGLPLRSDQISTSEAMLIIFKIMTTLNKKTPIFFLGRAESLDKQNLNRLFKEAEENGYQLFVDKVEDGPLQIDIVEPLS